MKASASSAGRLAFRAMIPLFGVAAAWFGGRSPRPIGLIECLVPPAGFLVTAFLTQSGPYVFATGLPPSTETFQMMSGGGAVAREDVALLWALTAVMLSFFFAAFAGYCWAFVWLGRRIAGRST